MTKPPPQRNYHLDAVRALAALSVLLTHLRSIFFVPYQEAGTGVLVKIFYIEHYLARGGVICFFVLSGYLVGGSVLRSLESGRWSWPDYLIRRISRLQMVLIPALVLTLVLDLAGQRLAWDAYADARGGFTAANFVGCLLFLQLVVQGFIPFGSNGALWSLSYEFWYYILFPLAVLVLLRPKNSLAGLPILAVVVWLTFGPVLFLFSCWLGGVLVVFLGRSASIRSFRIRLGMIVGSLLGFLGVTLACGAHRLPVDPADYLFALLTVVLLWACVSLPVYAGGAPYARSAIFLSEFSYTLYLTHQPFLQFVKAAWLGNGTWRPDPVHILLAGIPFLFAILLAWILYLLFESRTEQLRLFLGEKLRQVIPPLAGLRR